MKHSLCQLWKEAWRTYIGIHENYSIAFIHPVLMPPRFMVLRVMSDLSCLYILTRWKIDEVIFEWRINGVNILGSWTIAKRWDDISRFIAVNLKLSTNFKMNYFRFRLKKHQFIFNIWSTQDIGPQIPKRTDLPNYLI